MRRAVTAVVIAGAIFAFATPAVAEPGALEPYQMVRSLQLIQDRVAGGDAAALPMQRKLLEIVDKTFRNAKPSDFDNKRNLRALFIYAMSGGNPKTVKALMRRLDLDAGERDLGRGIVSYLESDFGAARDYLSSVDPFSLAPELGAFTALISGTVLTPEDPARALEMLDKARLLGPGTLVEEAALRRTVTLSAKLQDPERFVRASTQYVHRFLDSPYASQFADAFVAAVVKLRDRIDLDAVDGIVWAMTDEQAQAIYLRLARQSAIEGYNELLRFASTRAARFAEAGEGEDPRAVLYSTISSVTSDNVADVVERLDKLDRSRLSVDDRKLLDAAKAVAREVIAGLVPAASEAGAGANATLTEGTVSQAPAAADAYDVEKFRTFRETDQIVANTREKLDEIDRLLQETAQLQETAR